MKLKKAQISVLLVLAIVKCVVLSASDSPMLMKILQAVDVAVSDDHLFDVTLQLLKNLCVCMRDTLKVKEEKLMINGDLNSLLVEDPNYNDNILELYKSIYNSTCNSLRNELEDQLFRSQDDVEEGKHEKNNCSEHDQNHIKSALERHDGNFDINLNIESILFKTLVETTDLHNYSIKKSNLIRNSKILNANIPEQNLIIIITLPPKINQRKNELLSEQIEYKDVYDMVTSNNTPVDIDIYNTIFYDPSLENNNIGSKNVTNCNLYSLYTFIMEKKKNNQITVLKTLNKKEIMKIYINVKVNKSQSNFLNMCCINNDCEKGKLKKYLDYKKVNNTIHRQHPIIQNYKKIITKIKYLMKLYDEKVKGYENNNILGDKCFESSKKICEDDLRNKNTSLKKEDQKAKTLINIFNNYNSSELNLLNTVLKYHPSNNISMPAITQYKNKEFPKISWNQPQDFIAKSQIDEADIDLSTFDTPEDNDWIHINPSKYKSKSSLYKNAQSEKSISKLYSYPITNKRNFTVFNVIIEKRQKNHSPKIIDENASGETLKSVSPSTTYKTLIQAETSSQSTLVLPDAEKLQYPEAIRKLVKVNTENSQSLTPSHESDRFYTMRIPSNSFTKTETLMYPTKIFKYAEPQNSSPKVISAMIKTIDIPQDVRLLETNTKRIKKQSVSTENVKHSNDNNNNFPKSSYKLKHTNDTDTELITPNKIKKHTSDNIRFTSVTVSNISSIRHGSQTFSTGQSTGITNMYSTMQPLITESTKLDRMSKIFLNSNKLYRQVPIQLQKNTTSSHLPSIMNLTSNLIRSTTTKSKETLFIPTILRNKSQRIQSILTTDDLKMKSKFVPFYTLSKKPGFFTRNKSLQHSVTTKVSLIDTMINKAPSSSINKSTLRNEYLISKMSVNHTTSPTLAAISTLTFEDISYLKKIKENGYVMADREENPSSLTNKLFITRGPTSSSVAEMVLDRKLNSSEMKTTGAALSSFTAKALNSKQVPLMSAFSHNTTKPILKKRILTTGVTKSLPLEIKSPIKNNIQMMNTLPNKISTSTSSSVFVELSTLSNINNNYFDNNNIKSIAPDDIQLLPSPQIKFGTPLSTKIYKNMNQIEKPFTRRKHILNIINIDQMKKPFKRGNYIYPIKSYLTEIKTATTIGEKLQNFTTAKNRLDHNNINISNNTRLKSTTIADNYTSNEIIKQIKSFTETNSAKLNVMTQNETIGSIHVEIEKPNTVSSSIKLIAKQLEPLNSNSSIAKKSLKNEAVNKPDTSKISLESLNNPILLNKKGIKSVTATETIPKNENSSVGKVSYKNTNTNVDNVVTDNKPNINSIENKPLQNEILHAFSTKGVTVPIPLSSIFNTIESDNGLQLPSNLNDVQILSQYKPLFPNSSPLVNFTDYTGRPKITSPIIGQSKLIHQNYSNDVQSIINQYKTITHHVNKTMSDDNNKAYTHLEKLTNSNTKSSKPMPHYIFRGSTVDILNKKIPKSNIHPKKPQSNISEIPLKGTVLSISKTEKSWPKNVKLNSTVTLGIDVSKELLNKTLYLSKNLKEGQMKQKPSSILQVAQSGIYSRITTGHTIPTTATSRPFGLITTNTTRMDFNPVLSDITENVFVPTLINITKNKHYRTKITEIATSTIKKDMFSSSQRTLLTTHNLDRITLNTTTTNYLKTALASKLWTRNIQNNYNMSNNTKKHKKQSKLTIKKTHSDSNLTNNYHSTLAMQVLGLHLKKYPKITREDTTKLTNIYLVTKRHKVLFKHNQTEAVKKITTILSTKKPQNWIEKITHKPFVNTLIKNKFMDSKQTKISYNPSTNITLLFSSATTRNEKVASQKKDNFDLEIISKTTARPVLTGSKFSNIENVRKFLTTFTAPILDALPQKDIISPKSTVRMMADTTMKTNIMENKQNEKYNNLMNKSDAIFEVNDDELPHENITEYLKISTIHGRSLETLLTSSPMLPSKIKNKTATQLNIVRSNANNVKAKQLASKASLKNVTDHKIGNRIAFEVKQAIVTQIPRTTRNNIHLHFNKQGSILNFTIANPLRFNNTTEISAKIRSTSKMSTPQTIKTSQLNRELLKSFAVNPTINYTAKKPSSATIPIAVQNTISNWSTLPKEMPLNVLTIRDYTKKSIQNSDIGFTTLIPDIFPEVKTQYEYDSSATEAFTDSNILDHENKSFIYHTTKDKSKHNVQNSLELITNLKRSPTISYSTKEYHALNTNKLHDIEIATETTPRFFKIGTEIYSTQKHLISSTALASKIYDGLEKNGDTPNKKSNLKLTVTDTVEKKLILKPDHSVTENILDFDSTKHIDKAPCSTSNSPNTLLDSLSNTASNIFFKYGRLPEIRKITYTSYNNNNTENTPTSLLIKLPASFGPDNDISNFQKTVAVDKKITLLNSNTRTDKNIEIKNDKLINLVDYTESTTSRGLYQKQSILTNPYSAFTTNINAIQNSYVTLRLKTKDASNETAVYSVNQQPTFRTVSLLEPDDLSNIVTEKQILQTTRKSNKLLTSIKARQIIVNYKHPKFISSNNVNKAIYVTKKGNLAQNNFNLTRYMPIVTYINAKNTINTEKLSLNSYFNKLTKLAPSSVPKKINVTENMPVKKSTVKITDKLESRNSALIYTSNLTTRELDTKDIVTLSLLSLPTIVEGAEINEDLLTNPMFSRSLRTVSLRSSAPYFLGNYTSKISQGTNKLTYSKAITQPQSLITSYKKGVIPHSITSPPAFNVLRLITIPVTETPKKSVTYQSSKKIKESKANSLDKNPSLINKTNPLTIIHITDRHNLNSISYSPDIKLQSNSTLNIIQKQISTNRSTTKYPSTKPAFINITRLSNALLSNTLHKSQSNWTAEKLKHFITPHYIKNYTYYYKENTTENANNFPVNYLTNVASTSTITPINSMSTMKSENQIISTINLREEPRLAKIITKNQNSLPISTVNHFSNTGIFEPSFKMGVNLSNLKIFQATDKLQILSTRVFSNSSEIYNFTKKIKLVSANTATANINEKLQNKNVFPSTTNLLNPMFNREDKRLISSAVNILKLATNTTTTSKIINPQITPNATFVAKKYLKSSTILTTEKLNHPYSINLQSDSTKTQKTNKILQSKVLEENNSGKISVQIPNSLYKSNTVLQIHRLETTTEKLSNLMIYPLLTDRFTRRTTEKIYKSNKYVSTEKHSSVKSNLTSSLTSPQSLTHSKTTIHNSDFTVSKEKDKYLTSTNKGKLLISIKISYFTDELSRTTSKQLKTTPNLTFGHVSQKLPKSNAVKYESLASDRVKKINLNTKTTVIVPSSTISQKGIFKSNRINKIHTPEKYLSTENLINKTASKVSYTHSTSKNPIRNSKFSKNNNNEKIYNPTTSESLLNSIISSTIINANPRITKTQTETSTVTEKHILAEHLKTTSVHMSQKLFKSNKIKNDENRVTLKEKGLNINLKSNKIVPSSTLFFSSEAIPRKDSKKNKMFKSEKYLSPKKLLGLTFTTALQKLFPSNTINQTRHFTMFKFINEKPSLTTSKTLLTSMVSPLTDELQRISTRATEILPISRQTLETNSINSSTTTKKITEKLPNLMKTRKKILDVTKKKLNSTTSLSTAEFIKFSTQRSTKAPFWNKSLTTFTFIEPRTSIIEIPLNHNDHNNVTNDESKNLFRVSTINDNQTKIPVYISHNIATYTTKMPPIITYVNPSVAYSTSSTLEAPKVYKLEMYKNITNLRNEQQFSNSSKLISKTPALFFNSDKVTLPYSFHVLNITTNPENPVANKTSTDFTDITSNLLTNPFQIIPENPVTQTSNSTVQTTNYKYYNLGKSKDNSKLHLGKRDPYITMKYNSNLDMKASSLITSSWKNEISLDTITYNFPFNNIDYTTETYNNISKSEIGEEIKIISRNTSKLSNKITEFEGILHNTILSDQHLGDELKSIQIFNTENTADTKVTGNIAEKTERDILKNAFNNKSKILKYQTGNLQIKALKTTTEKYTTLNNDKVIKRGNRSLENTAVKKSLSTKIYNFKKNTKTNIVAVNNIYKRTTSTNFVENSTNKRLLSLDTKTKTAIQRNTFRNKINHMNNIHFREYVTKLTTNSEKKTKKYLYNLNTMTKNQINELQIASPKTDYGEHKTNKNLFSNFKTQTIPPLIIKTVKYNTYQPKDDDELDFLPKLENNRFAQSKPKIHYIVYPEYKMHTTTPVYTSQRLATQIVLKKITPKLNKKQLSTRPTNFSIVTALTNTKQVTKPTIFKRTQHDYNENNKKTYRLRSKMKKITKIGPSSHSGPFNNTKMLPVQFLPPQRQRKVLRTIEISKKSEFAPSLYFLSNGDVKSHWTPERQRPTPVIIKEKKPIILRPRFNFEPYRLITHSPYYNRPKPLLIENLNDQDFYKTEQEVHRSRDMLTMNEKAKFVEDTVKQKYKSVANLDTVIEPPTRLVPMRKAHFLRDRIDFIRDFVSGYKAITRSAKHRLKENIYKMPMVESPEALFDNSEPSGYYYSGRRYFDAVKNQNQIKDTTTTQKMIRKKRKRRTIFFLSPTVPYNRYF